MKRIALVALWLAATAATTVIAYIAVNAADAEVNKRPSSAVVASAHLSRTDTSTTLANPTSGGATNSSASTTGPNPTSSTTIATPTTLSAPWQQSTINSVGGLVIVSYRPGEVRLESITPHPGFFYEVEEEGPPEVRVEFQASHLKIEIRAEWDEGLVTEIDDDS